MTSLSSFHNKSTPLDFYSNFGGQHEDIRFLFVIFQLKMTNISKLIRKLQIAVTNIAIAYKKKLLL